MIHNLTYLNLIDNTGAKEIQCIRVLNKSKRKPGSLGSKLIISVKTSIVKEKQKIKNNKMYTSLITNVKKKKKRKDGSTNKSSKNCAVLINAQQSPLASRITSFLPYEISNKEHPKLTSMVKLSL